MASTGRNPAIPKIISTFRSVRADFRCSVTFARHMDHESDSLTVRAMRPTPAVVEGGDDFEHRRAVRKGSFAPPFHWGRILGRTAVKTRIAYLIRVIAPAFVRTTFELWPIR